jgi:hypothetical protein
MHSSFGGIHRGRAANESTMLDRPGCRSHPPQHRIKQKGLIVAHEVEVRVV